MTISSLFRVVVTASTSEFVELVRLAELDPRHAFKQAELTRIDLRKQNLAGFNFAGASFAQACFHEAALVGADFSGADLSKAEGLTIPMLGGAIYNRETKWPSYFGNMPDLADFEFEREAKRLIVSGKTPPDEWRPFVKSLRLGQNTLANLRPLENMTEIESLTIPQTRTSDITAISRLKKIRHLVLRNNPVFDLAPISQSTSLSFLDISKTFVTDIRPLDQLINLAHFDCQRTNIANLAPLSGCREVRYVNVSGCPIENLDAFRDASQLRARHKISASTIKCILLISQTNK